VTHLQDPVLTLWSPVSQWSAP